MNSQAYHRIALHVVTCYVDSRTQLFRVHELFNIPECCAPFLILIDKQWGPSEFDEIQTRPIVFSLQIESKIVRNLHPQRVSFGNYKLKDGING